MCKLGLSRYRGLSMLLCGRLGFSHRYIGCVHCLSIALFVGKRVNRFFAVLVCLCSGEETTGLGFFVFQFFFVVDFLWIKKIFWWMGKYINNKKKNKTPKTKLWVYAFKKNYRLKKGQLPSSLTGLAPWNIVEGPHAWFPNKWTYNRGDTVNRVASGKHPSVIYFLPVEVFVWCMYFDLANVLLVSNR